MPQTLIALLTAFLIDITLGDPPNHLHPVVLMGNFIRLGTKLFNQGKNFRRFISGMLLILLGGALFSLPWLLLNRFLPHLPFWVCGVLLGLLLRTRFLLSADC